MNQKLPLNFTTLRDLCSVLYERAVQMKISLICVWHQSMDIFSLDMATI